MFDDRFPRFKTNFDLYFGDDRVISTLVFLSGKRQGFKASEKAIFT